MARKVAVALVVAEENNDVRLLGGVGGPKGGRGEQQSGDGKQAARDHATDSTLGGKRRERMSTTIAVSGKGVCPYNMGIVVELAEANDMTRQCVLVIMTALFTQGLVSGSRAGAGLSGHGLEQSADRFAHAQADAGLRTDGGRVCATDRVGQLSSGRPARPSSPTRGCPNTIGKRWTRRPPGSASPNW